LIKLKWIVFADFMQVWVCFVGVALTSISQILLRVELSMGRRVIVNVIPAAVSLLVFCMVLVLSVSMEDAGVFWYIVLVQLFPGVMTLYYLLTRQSNLIRLNHYCFKKFLLNLIPGSSRFAFTTLLGLLVLQIDYLVISRFFEPSDAAKYNLVMRVFGFVGLINSTALNTMWPLITESYHRGDVQGLIGRGRQLVWLGLGMMSFTIVITLVFRDFIFVRVFRIAQDQQPDYLLILCIGFFWTMRVWADVYSVFLQAMNVPQTLICPVLVQSILGVSLMSVLIPVFGVSSIPLSLGLGFVLSVGWYLPLSVKKIIQY
jgi:O-antigen/teichoic acid export membrane protein